MIRLLVLRTECVNSFETKHSKAVYAVLVSAGVGSGH